MNVGGKVQISVSGNEYIEVSLIEIRNKYERSKCKMSSRFAYVKFVGLLEHLGENVR